jgi:hypothetical protein
VPVLPLANAARRLSRVTPSAYAYRAETSEYRGTVPQRMLTRSVSMCGDKQMTQIETRGAIAFLQGGGG